MIACRDCIEYFTIGHFYDGRSLEHRPLNTLDPNLNAIAWGMIATWHICTLAGAFFALLARIPFPGLITTITAAQLAPYIAIAAAIAFVVSHIFARIEQVLVAAHPSEIFEGVPLEYQAGWAACNTRNGTGYLSIGIGGVILSIAIIASRAGLFPL